MKSFLKFIFFAWIFWFVIDYVSFKLSKADKTAFCKSYMKQHIALHLIAPGWGNGCLDLGFLPEKSEK